MLQAMAQQREDRGLKAILVADVAGYSSRVEVDEAGTLSSWAALRAAITDPLVASHHGRVFKAMGDALLVEFASAVQALRCAMAIQDQNNTRNATLPPDAQLQLRIGLHLGDVVIENEDLLGHAVNIAARIQALAEPGGICVSETLLDSTSGTLKPRVDDLGFAELKNIAQRVRVFRIRQSRATAAPATPRGFSPAQLRRYVMSGRRLPDTWVPLIEKLSFRGEYIADLSPLANLTQLCELDLGQTHVTDLAPLAGLTNLRRLNLEGTHVSDLAPLAKLRELRELDLWGAPVRYIAPLGALNRLMRVNLRATLVRDVAALAAHSSLQSLILLDAPVHDVIPLQGLVGLRELSLMNTRVTDITPLSGLVRLQELDLSGTNIADLAPLAGLRQLVALDLRDTPVTNLAPLSGIASLEILHLHRTKVMDLAPLVGLPRLEHVSLTGTRADPAPLHHRPEVFLLRDG